MGKPLKYSKVKVVKISDIQDKSLKKLRGYNVNVSQFIRNAIKEKLERDYSTIIKQYNESKNDCPF